MRRTEKQIAVNIDPRTWLFHILIGVMAIILVHSDKGGLFLFLWCLCLHLLTKQRKYVPAYLFAYLIFGGFAWIGVKLLPDPNWYFVGLAFSNIGILGRKAIIPLSFTIYLAKEPTGSLLAALQALRLPKVVGIGLAVLLRFFPTIVDEYRAIRASQRFRKIGVGVFHTLIHLPSTVEYILIPLILRATKVSEELSASMTVRGVRFSGETISFRYIKFQGRDMLLCLIAMLVPIIILLR